MTYDILDGFKTLYDQMSEQTGDPTSERYYLSKRRKHKVVRQQFEHGLMEWEEQSNGCHFYPKASPKA